MGITAVTSLRPIFRPTFTVHSQRIVKKKVITDYVDPTCYDKINCRFEKKILSIAPLKMSHM